MLSDSNRIITGFALFKFLFHALIAVFAGYGIFRDELYYLACSDHLSFGYVDQPPLSIWILALFKSIFGDSLMVIRLVSALAGGLSMYFLGKSVREMGGSVFAITVACLAYLISPINLGYLSFYSMNSLDLLGWILSYYLVIRLINEGDKKLWIILGIVLGLSLLNKISTLFLGTGLFVAIVASPLRKWLKTPWPYIAGIIAFLMFSPYVIWNLMYDLPHLEFIENAKQGKYSGLSAFTFISGQFLLNHPLNLMVYLLGLAYFFFNSSGKKYMPMGVIFLVTTVILSVNGQSKSEYLAGAIAILYAGGGLWLETLLQKKTWARYAVIIFLASGMLLSPLAAPLLSQENFIAYSQFLGLSKSNDEGNEEGKLPQFYADMHGWEDKAKAVSLVYQSLSEEEKNSAIIYTSNYGRAGAIDYYRDRYELPLSFSGHNNYWLWGPPDFEVKTVILMASELRGAVEIFEQIDEVGLVQCEYCMPYEQNLKIYIARNPKTSINQLWSELKSYQ